MLTIYAAEIARKLLVPNAILTAATVWTLGISHLAASGKVIFSSERTPCGQRHCLGGPNGIHPWPTTTGPAITEVSVICARMCHITKIEITSCPSKTRFLTLSNSVICAGDVPARKSLLSLHFLFWVFAFLFLNRVQRKTLKEEAGALQDMADESQWAFRVGVRDWVHKPLLLGLLQHMRKNKHK